MKRTIWLAGACLIGGLMVIAVVSGLQGPARTAEAIAQAESARDVVINEVAWGGTDASTWDEWIELHNTTGATVSLAGWTISFADGSPTTITLSGEIGPDAYFLLERADKAVSNLKADLEYGGGQISNGGEQMMLRDGTGTVIDTANADGGDWAAGSAGPEYRSMERIDPTAPDTDDNWCTNDGLTRNGVDADGDPINGTPKAQNSCYQPPAGDVPDLIVSKTGPITSTPGSLITYHIALSNAGGVAAPAVRVTDTLPAAVSLVTQTSVLTFSRLDEALLWDVGDVATGTQHVITITGRVTETASGILTNLVTATTTASETAVANNADVWETSVEPSGEARVLISAVLYDGYQSDDPDEAVQLVNVGTAPANLAEWQLCDEQTGGTCAALPATTLPISQRLWLANWATDFYTSFGFLPDLAVHPSPGVGGLGDSWPGYANSGDEVILRNSSGSVVDVVVYKQDQAAVSGWSGPAVEPYSAGRQEGQILYRIPDEATGLPISDTNTAADWIQYRGDANRGRRVLYPGWDLHPFFWPLTVTEQATVTAGIAPDNAFDVVSGTIARARRAISIEAYSLRQPEIVAALVQKAHQGVSVTVLLEGQQALVSHTDPKWQQQLWACQQIEDAGGQCWFMVHETDDRIFNRYHYLHAKLLIVDDEWVVLGSQNLSNSSLPSDDKSNGTWGSRGAVLATNAPSVVARASEVFARDLDPVHHNDILRWNTAYTDEYGEPIHTPALTIPDHVTYTVRFPEPLTISGTMDFELFTAPEAALRQSDALLGLVARAGVSDTVYVEQLYEYQEWGDDPADDPNLRLKAYLAAARRGAKVRILLNGGTFDEPAYRNVNTDTVSYVNQLAQSEGLDLEAAIGDPTLYGIHNKMVLVWAQEEGGYSHIGSINGSEGSSKVNREIALQVRSDEIYRYLAQAFEADWRLAHPMHLPLVMDRYTPPPPPADYVVVSEVMYRPRDQLTGNREWVELHNPSDQPIDVSGWYLGDAAAPRGFGAGLYRFPQGTALMAGGTIVIAQQAEDFQGVSGFSEPDFEFLIDPNRDDQTVPNMDPAGDWEGFRFALGDSGDKVVLRDADEVDVDAVAYGDAAYPGVVPHAGGVDYNWSLERRPPYRDTDDCSADFFPRYPSTPGSVPP